MPRFVDDDSMESGITIQGTAGSSFHFSAVKIEDLDETAYTLVTVAVDVSSSVFSFKKELDACLASIVRACLKSQRAENLLLRVIEFNDSVREVHGFTPLSTINPDDYDLRPGGMTALYDAAYSSLGACITRAESMIKADYDVNAICFVITDGENNRGKTTPNMIKLMKEGAKSGEKVGDILTCLIGVNMSNKAVKAYLEDFEKDAGFDKFLPIDSADPDSIANVAAFITKSVSLHSQSLLNGAPSQALTFTT